MQLLTDLRGRCSSMSFFTYIRSRLVTGNTLALAGLLTIIFLISQPSLFNPDIDDLDSAHHLMDGYFFRDLIIDHPVSHLPAYALNYYKQYPALGFLFWPPVFPFVLGLFCLMGGVHVLTARLCIAFFGLIFSFAFYAILRRRLSVWLSFAATVAAITMPGIAWSFNEVMLELPALAMMCLAVLAYLNVIDHLDEPTSVGRGLLCATACAAVIYTKQPAWFLYPALGLDFLILHRRFLRKLEVLIAITATVIICMPLTFFTFTYGRANLSQAVLHDPRFVRVLHIASLPRWSLAAWTYYPKLVVSLVNPAVALLVIGAIVLAVFSRRFMREHVLWLNWFLFAYLTFSYYDNRQPRFATFWWPSLVALAAYFLGVLMKLTPRKLAWTLPLFLLLPVPWQIRTVWRTDYTDFRQVQPPIAALFEKGDPGNILLFGNEKQIMVALVREHDLGRTVHVVRGERLVGDTQTLAEVCRKYRIGTVVVELSENESMDQLKGLSNLIVFKPIQDSRFFRRGMPIRLQAYRYEGPIDPKMAEISLSKDLL